MVVVVVVVVVVTAPQRKDPRRSRQVGLGSEQAQVRFTRWQPFLSENGSQSVPLPTNSVLAEPSLPLRQSATNSLRVGAENLTMTDLLMVYVMCEADKRKAPCVMESFHSMIVLPRFLSRLCCDDQVLDSKSTFVSDAFKFLAVS